MMDLRVSVVLLFVFLTGGYSLKCYSCISALMETCERTVECPDGISKCASYTTEASVGVMLSTTTKGCVAQCVPRTGQGLIGRTTTRCCDTDLCNAADGVYKGSFLLLFSPLLFYFLFQ